VSATTTEEQEPRKVKMFRIVPQLKTFKTGTLLKSKIDLYYSLEEDVVQVGGGDATNAFNLLGGAGAGNSFPMSSDFIAKETYVIFAEAAQFRADDNNIYVRLKLMSSDKVIWVNLLKIPTKQWSFLINHERKERIKEEINNMFEVTVDE
jgi:hypothetical protein